MNQSLIKTIIGSVIDATDTETGRVHLSYLDTLLNDITIQDYDEQIPTREELDKGWEKLRNSGLDKPLDENEFCIDDNKFTKNEVILLMEKARDKGKRDGDILWDEWLEKIFDEFNT